MGRHKIMRERDTNLELFRIIVMFFIVLHHYVVNSGLMSPDGVILLLSDEF